MHRARTPWRSVSAASSSFRATAADTCYPLVPEPGHWRSTSTAGIRGAVVDVHGAEVGGFGARLRYWWPVGVVVTMVPSCTWVAQPRRSFVRLQRVQRPLPLRRSVSPPLATARAWSACRIGAPHHGVRHTWSRAVRNTRATCGKSRRRAFVAARPAAARATTNAAAASTIDDIRSILPSRQQNADVDGTSKHLIRTY